MAVSDVPTFDEDPNAISKGGLFSGPFDSEGLDSNTRALIAGDRWTTSFNGTQIATTIPYSFPTQVQDYTVVPGYALDPLYGFLELTADQKEAARSALALVSSYTTLTFVEVSSPLADDAAIRIAHNGKGGSEAYYPFNGIEAGDTFIGGNGNTPAQYFGSDGFLTIMHELGHALGLKHGHEATPNGALDPSVDDNEFSVMTYRSYLDSPADQLPTTAYDGSAPQSYMMYDIAALQALYDANFSKGGTFATYKWDPVTGQETINGVPAPLTGPLSAGNKIFTTVWTAGAITTYDLSAFHQNQVDDLRPSGWLIFSHDQIADLNNQADPGTPQFQAQGNVYNALLHEGDLRSAIANLVTGDGNDTIIDNLVDNVLTSNAGNDTIQSSSGDDTISAGAGADQIQFGTGHDVLRDTLADLNGDQVWGFGPGYSSAIDVQGAQFGRDSLHIEAGDQAATFQVGASTVLLNGLFTGGDFMVDTRGSGDQMHTTFSYVPFMPGLAEGVQVDPAAVNGVANQPFLTGDGHFRFSLTFDSSVTSLANTLGYYQVSADGTIHDVHVLFGNTLDVAPGQTIDLGVPANDERIGFFLIQDGFRAYGNLPDDLFFLSPQTDVAAKLTEGVTPFLLSASEGALTVAQVFHSFDRLNPAGAPQVLSGLLPGTHTLQLGFEDMPNGKGDNDFQDVVVTIHVSQDGHLLA